MVARRSVPSDSLWLPSSASTFPLGKGPVLVLDREQVIVCEIEPITAAVLSRCHGVRSLQEYIAQAWTAGISPSPTAITDAIDTLVSSGLLRLIGPPLHHPAETASPALLDTAAIITADRPRALARALDALGRDRARPLHVVVVDGSTTDRAAARDAATHSPRSVSVLYVGAGEADRLRRRLSSRGIPKRVLDASLTPGGIGSGRNIATLLTAGRPVLMQDDDVAAGVWTDEGVQEGLAVGGHVDLRAWRFFETRDQAHAAIRFVDVDIAAAHGSVLGLSLGHLLAHVGDRVDYEQACPHMIAALNDAARRKVRVTFAGLAGDAARNCSHSLLFRSGAVRQQLWEDEALFMRAVRSREVAVASRRLVVTHDPACVGYCMGIDNATTVPPFMPIGRNEDGVWGATLAFIDPRALYAHLPWGVWHDSNRPSRYETPMPSARQSRVSEFLLFVITRVATATFATAQADRLRHLGRLFGEVAALPPADFRALVAEAKLSVMSQELTRAEAATFDPACPTHWRRAVDEYQRVFRESVVRPNYFLPIEFRTDSPDDGFARLQRFVGDFGELLIWWPEIWEAARSMNLEDRTEGPTWLARSRNG